MLTVHRAERADALAGGLAAVLARPSGDPFAREVVAVPSHGIERWLSQRLSNVLGASTGRGDGVCANVEFPFPQRLVGVAVQAVTGIDPAADPWSPARAVWPLIDIIDGHLDESWMGVLRVHLGIPGDDAREGRRFVTARHLADLFDRYGVHRPAMINRWAAGDDVDGLDVALPADLAWQATLWRRLRHRLGVPSPAERLGPACAALRAGEHTVELPDRVSLFGLTRLAPSMLAVLDAVAAWREVHLFVLHPSPALWDRVAATGGSTATAEHPLLATWGKDAREMQIALTATLGAPTRTHHPGDVLTGGLLRRLQADVRADARPPGPPSNTADDRRMLLGPDDDSVQVHSCHGRARQVEVLRDAILHLLADDATLEPRDVIVMCPDIEEFAPLIHATFGAVENVAPQRGAPLPSLQVRLADRAVRQTNPVLAALSDLLELTSARVTAPQLVDFAGLEPVRRRFRLDDDDLARVEEWLSAAGVRWGLDARHRAPFALDAVGSNTWRAGLDRVLLGVSMTEDDQPLVGGALPLDDVDSGDIELAGRLAELVDRVHAAIDRLTSRQPVLSWANAIAAAVDALTACTPRDAWQRHQLDQLLEDVVQESGGTPLLSLPELRALLADRLRGRPSRANFRTGHLTICTLVPMRSVPHRVVCLLGLDDGSFPRQGAADGDDIIERAAQIGDRNVRSEDRQLLLDALLAAGDHLVVVYGGRDERSNAIRPPSVPIGELLDVIDATARLERGPARRHVLVEHPLQPFDRRNFHPDRPWSFDATALDGAVAQTAPRTARPSFLPTRLPPLDSSIVELDDLVRFVQHPTRAFLRQRLGISLTDRDDVLDDAIPVELDGLGRWGVGQRLLEARLRRTDWPTALAAERARGLLPPGRLGEQVIDEVRPTVEAIHLAAVASIGGAGDPRAVDIVLHLGPREVLSGTVADLYGDTLVSATYSRVAAKHRLAAWVRLLALAAAEPGRERSAATVGRARSGGAAVATIAPLGVDQAATHLRSLLDLYRRGMCEPLPLYCNTSEALARHRNARDEWETGTGRFDKEDRDPEHVFVLGRDVPFPALLRDPPRPDEDGPDWPSGDGTRLGRFAARLWDGLLAVEERVGV